MVARHKRAQASATGGDYFPDAGTRPVCVLTGCTLLDCVLGGGWPLGRIVNIVGDKSTGKTLLAIEACANFGRQYPNGKIYYREAESAFDQPYAERVGLPKNRVDFGKQGLDTQWRTIEDIFVDLRAVAAWHAKNKVEGIYVIDSLDALTSRAALARDVGEGSFNLEKQRVLAQLFEQLVSEFKAAKLLIVIVSQIRDKIGFVVGEKHRRSGGKSLDFYATHIVWLAHLKTLVRTISGEKRPTGILVQANCKKNKVSDPFRKCTFPIRFGYGVDDVEASIDWLVEVGMADRLGIKKKRKTKKERAEERAKVEKARKRGEGEPKEKASDPVDDYLDEMADMNLSEYAKRAAQIRMITMQAWEEIEAQFRPTRKKYG